ncbi:MAG TPA: N,N-dimethylformamidase beta subunit family domain-containing protein [Stellaceae bacterium]|nr:N,N-dimethylformamidase beta subunit family domain-containing protein [Stellaceae bacterium]
MTMKSPDGALGDDERYRAVFTNYAERPPQAGGNPGIWCYTDRLSYAAGETVVVHACTTARSFDAVLLRDGAAPREVLRRTALAGAFHETPADCSIAGCGWPAAFAFTIEPDWPSGAYRLTLTSGELACEHLFIVRPPPGDRAGRLLLVAATATWTAYNDWGGSNHYEGLTGPTGDRPAPEVSTLRPWARGFVTLPPDAPRAGLAAPPAFGTPVRYPHMEWAWRTGHSKKYASSGWASYERHFVAWAERQGYAVDIVSQTDLHYRPELLDGYACVVFTGHDEYWSWEMRDAIDAYVESGGRVARFAGNFMWQIRLENAGTRQICHKYRAREDDPLYRTERRHLTTGAWEAAETGRPAALTFGLNALRGLYAGWGGCAPRGPGGFSVYRPEHWAFAGTGLGYGDLLGGESRAFGYEVDGLDYEIRGGLPYPAPGEVVPEGLEILALGLTSLVETGPGSLFLGQEDAEYIAGILHGSGEALERVKRGAGMIVHFRRGRGEVFHAGSCDWVAGLIRGDPYVAQVTRTVLDRYLQGQLVGQHPHPNPPPLSRERG